MFSTKKIKRVFVIVKKFSDSSYLLLISSKKHTPMGLPGGRYDSDDLGPINTAHRELYEETRIDIEDVSRFKYIGLLNNKLFYLLEISDKESETIITFFKRHVTMYFISIYLLFLFKYNN